MADLPYPPKQAPLSRDKAANVVGVSGRAVAQAKAAPGKPSEKKDGADLHHLIDRAPKSSDKAAGVVGVSGRAVAQAKRVEKHAPDLAEKVRTGELALDKAEKQVSRLHTRYNSKGHWYDTTKP